MKTAQEKREDFAIATDTLERYREEITSGSALVMFSFEAGKGLTDYLRVSLLFNNKENKILLANLTWAIGCALGYSLRDRSGYWFLAIRGYGFSKTDEVARALANYYGIDRIRYERN